MEIQIGELEFEKVVKKINIKRIPGYLDFASRVDIEYKNPLYSKIDFILKRVLHILGLNPLSYKELEENVVISIGTYDEGKGFYDKRSGEIKINYKNLNEFVLAHELTHLILDYYFNTRFSRSMHEILAVYVYKNLKAKKLLWINKL